MLWSVIDALKSFFFDAYTLPVRHITSPLRNRTSTLSTCTNPSGHLKRHRKVAPDHAPSSKRLKIVTPLDEFRHKLKKARKYFEDDNDLDTCWNIGNTTYGRLLPKAIDSIFSHLKLTSTDIFIDFGHGVGNTVLQAAYTRRCKKARGIEVVQDRYQRSLEYSTFLNIPATFVWGDFTDPQYRDFLTRGGAIKAFANNYDGFWSERSQRSACDLTKPPLDDYLAGLFAHMPPGSILVTMSPLRLGLSLAEAEITQKRNGWPNDPRRSFYKVEEIVLGKRSETFSWSKSQLNSQNATAYMYTRLAQGGGFFTSSSKAVFLCCNPSCQNCKDCVPIGATRLEEKTGKLLINHCGSCKLVTRNLRARKLCKYKS